MLLSNFKIFTMEKGHSRGAVRLPLPSEFRGIWLPKELLTDDNLTLSEAVLLSVIKALSERRGYCYAGSDYLSEFIKVKGKTTVRNMIYGLKKRGYLETVPGTGNRRSVRLDSSTSWVEVAS